jgi:hypothetical protein
MIFPVVIFYYSYQEFIVMDIGPYVSILYMYLSYFMSETVLYFLGSILYCYGNMDTEFGCKQDNISQTPLFFECFCDCFLRNILRIFLEYC